MPLPIVGVVEGVERAPDESGLCGWAIAFDERIAGFLVAVDGEPAVATLARERPDLRSTFPATDAKGFAGLSLRFSHPSRDPRSPLSFEVVVLGERLDEIGRIPFVHDPAGLETPLPPAELRARSTRTSDAAFWRIGGLQTAGDLLRAWRRHDDRPSGLRALDFGSGVARLTPHFARADGIASCAGTDVDHDAIAWCRSAFPGLDFRPAVPTAPLPFADASFDLVFAYSVFTHLAPEDEHRALAELHRVTAPDARLLLTVHGPSVLRLKAPELLPVFERDGFLDRGPDPILDAFLPPGFYREVFHAAPYLHRTWSPFFEILAILPGGTFGYQDLVVLRRR